MRTLNFGAGSDDWGTDRLDKYPVSPKVSYFDFNWENGLPFEKEIFDEMRMHVVISDMLYPQRWLQEAYRVLKHKGKLSISEANPHSLRFAFNRMPFGIKGGRSETGIYYKAFSCYNVPTLKNRLEAAGFVVEKVYFERNTFLFNDKFYIVSKKG